MKVRAYQREYMRKYAHVSVDLSNAGGEVEMCNLGCKSKAMVETFFIHEPKIHLSKLLYSYISLV